MSPRVVLVPEFVPGRGSGHLARVLELAQELRGDCAAGDDQDRRDRVVRADGAGKCETGVLFHPGVDPETARRAVQRLAAAADIPLYFDPAVTAGAQLVVLDCRELSLAGFRALRLDESDAAAVGIDLGGSARCYCDYLIDTLPRVDSACAPNLADRGLLRFPRVARAFAPAAFEHVLLSFGGEDAANLTATAAEALRRVNEDATGGTRGCGQMRVSAVRGPLFEHDLPDEVEELPLTGRLRDQLWQFDLVITSFGLTAFEAAAAGCGVVLLSPTRYHAQLAARASFVHLGVCPSPARLARSLRTVCADPARVVHRSRAVIPEKPAAPATAIAELNAGGAAACPVCGRRAAASVTRTPGRTYVRCPQCGVLYMRRLRESGVAYDERYFFESYRRQYGRSYLEDFAHIKRVGEGRIERINRTIRAGRAGDTAGTPGGNCRAVLDIGAAYGPFLAAARESGYRVYGIDVSEAAVRYLREQLQFEAAACSIEEFDSQAVFGRARFDVVTMWYVIEHLHALNAVLSRVNAMLPVGGLFAFSTPNGEGISARRNRAAFLAAGPPDHVTIWEPGRCSSILERFGFRVRRVIVTGHHAERFPGMSRAARGGLRFRIADCLSRAAGLGDTFELYAVKERECKAS